MAQEASVNPVDLTSMEGKWYIHQSNFPMWLKGDKKSPTLNYRVKTTKEDTVLIDRVEYFKKNKLKDIKGISTPQNKENTAFEWRGNGILCLLRSKWNIVHMDEENDWALIYFEKTLFTPKGYDVLSRNPTLSDDVKSIIKETLIKLGVTEELTTIEQKH